MSVGAWFSLVVHEMIGMHNTACTDLVYSVVPAESVLFIIENIQCMFLGPQSLLMQE
jgi:hypothetical protein